MKMLTLNRSETAHSIAKLVNENLLEKHRGAFRMYLRDTDSTYCVVLFGNDGYECGASADHEARTKAYVHNLYAGFANLLPEGAVEFGTDKEGYSWCIVGHFPRGNSSSDFLDEVMEQCWADVVWQQWESQLSLSGA